MQTYKIAIVAGDGIGPEVVASGIAIMDAAVGVAGEFAIEYVAAPSRAQRRTWSAEMIFRDPHWRLPRGGADKESDQSLERCWPQRRFEWW